MFKFIIIIIVLYCYLFIQRTGDFEVKKPGMGSAR